MNELNFSAADWCFLKDEDPLEYYTRLVSAGFDAAETVSPARFVAARAAGIAILNTDAPGKADGVNKLENHAWLIPQIMQSIGLAADNGIPYLIVFSGERKGQTEQDGLDNCTAAFRTLADVAAKRGVIMVFEMINTFDIPDYLAASSAFGFELERRVSSPAFKLLYDVFHMQVMGEDVAGDIEQHVNAIGHIHVSQVPGMISPKIAGAIDFREVVSQACAAGYTGRWGLEFHPAGDVVEELSQVRNLFNSYIPQQKKG